MRPQPKALLLIITGAILLSLATTTYSLLLFGDHQAHTTGRATSEIGEVRISMNMILSITADDDTINFTGCTRGSAIYSDQIDAGGACRGMVPDNFSIRNDGTVPANVSVNFSDRGETHGGTFLDSTQNSSWIAYRVSNESGLVNYAGGCRQEMQESWRNVTGQSLPVCRYLTSGPINNSVVVDIAIGIPQSVIEGKQELDISFIASPT